MALIVDTASASPRLTGDDLRRWAENHSAFISSEMSQLQRERQAVAAALRDVGLRVVMFEDLGGRDETAERSYLDGVASSDIYIGIVGDRYGTMQPSGRSPTHDEYLHARQLGRRISVWVQRPGSDRQGNARDFVQEVQTFHTTGSFSEAGDLAARVADRIAEIAADDEAPWVKAGEAVLRADVIRDAGDTVEIESTVRDERVARYLNGLRARRLGQAEPIVITTADGSAAAQIQELVSETRSRSARRIKLRAVIDSRDSYGSSLDSGAQGYSADDLTEIGLRAGLFGEPVPERLGGLDFMVDPTDPLDPLRNVPIPEGSFGAIAHLLVVENLQQARRASLIDEFSIGPPHGGHRRLRLVYREPLRYTNVEPQERIIEGDIDW